MTTKKFLRMAPLAILLAIAIPASSAIVAPGSTTANSTPTTENPRAQQLLQRLEEIKDMNKSELTGSEKKELRQEVKGIKKEMKTLSGGVYLSVGAIIIVVLLLILLL
jgi:HPt (histidine-containing phosphotransfer) domain-containing protein